MSLKNNKGDLTPFDFNRPPCRQSGLLLPLIWGLSFLQAKSAGLCLDRSQMRDFKPPYLLLSAHQGPLDYAVAPLAVFPHHANYISDMEGFAAYGKELYRKVGCIGKRRFTPDYTILRHIKKVLFDQKDILVLFPESRHSNIGITSLISDSTARLIRYLGVPVATLSIHGSYLANPFWDESHTRKTSLTAAVSPCFTAAQTQTLAEDEIMKIIRSRLSYDEYRYQQENRIEISFSKRAEGLHLPLYRCPECEGEEMVSQNAELFCRCCGSKWILTPFGKLDGPLFSHPPDWYLWQRENVEREAAADVYSFSGGVRIEALANEKGFISLGKGRLSHTEAGFRLEGEKCLNLRGEKTLFFPTRRLESLQTEYNYRGKGPCAVLSNRDCCYYCYGEEKPLNVTKMQFAAEYFYRKQRETRNR